MKEDLQSRLLEMLTSIQNATSKAADFALAELPDIAQQYIAFGRIFETFMFAVGTAALCFLVWVTIKIFRDVNKRASVVPAGATAFFFFLWVHQVKNVVLVWAAPKIWLITELAKLVK